MLKRKLKRYTKQVLGSIEKATLPRLPKLWSDSPLPPAAMVLVYRVRNSALVEKLILECLQANVRPLLWGLDGIAPALTEHLMHPLIPLQLHRGKRIAWTAWS